MISNDELLKINFQIKETPSNNKASSTHKRTLCSQINMCVYHFHCAAARTLYLFSCATQNVLSNLRREQRRFAIYYDDSLKIQSKSAISRGSVSIFCISGISTLWARRSVSLGYILLGKLPKREMYATHVKTLGGHFCFNQKSLLFFPRVGVSTL